MGVYTWRPNREISGSGRGGYVGGAQNASNLWDGSDSTYVYFNGSDFFSSAGQEILGMPTIPAGAIPAGRRILGLRVSFRQQNTSSYDGWAEAYIRDQVGALINSSRNWGNDGYSTSWRTKNGPWIYNAGGASAFDPATIANYSIKIGYYADDSRVSDVWIDALYEEPLTAPSVPYPANAATVDTSNPALSVQGASPQAGQLVRAEFQLARDNGFTTEARSLYSSYHDRVGATERTTLSGQADIGPGLWYMRTRMVDTLGNVSAWSTTTTFTVTHAALPVPSNIAPAPGSISVNPYGIRTARVGTAPTDSRDVGIEWQFSKVNTFATGVVGWKNLANRVTTGDVSYDALPKTGVTPGQYGYNVSPDDVSQYLSQGTWYYRTRTVDKWNQNSAWSTVDSFTVQHPPQAQNVSPASSKVIDQNVTPIRWTFGDPWNGDAQTAYQVRVYDQNNTMVYDSTKLSSTSLQHFLALASQYLYQDLKFTVNLWDKDDVTSTQVGTNNFIFSNSPAIVMNYPAQGEIVLTGQPTFQWNPGIGRPGTIQRSYELKVYRMDNNNLVYNSGEVVSTATSLTPPNVILRNAVDYRLTLRIVDSDGLTSTLNRNFRAEYQAPPEPVVTVDPSSYLQNGYALVDWTTTVPDSYFIAWKVYRRVVGTTDWELIHTEEDSAVRTYHDWLVPSVDSYQYTVTQLADRSGFILESGLDEESPSYFIASEDYWLIDPDDESNNVKLYSVVDDSFTDEIEQNEYIVKGRGRRINYGTRIGISGQLSVQLRYNSNMSAREAQRVIRDIQQSMKSVLLRDPFGNITRVSLGALGVNRVSGVGWQEFADVDIPYSEVFE